MSVFWWCVAALGLGTLILVMIIVAFTQKPETNARWPKVCEVWNRWKRLKKDSIHFNVRQTGDGWQGNVCPQGHFEQLFNRRDVACVKKPEEATMRICENQISNDNVAIAVPSTKNDQFAAVDHWVTILEDIQFDAGKKRGKAWEKNNICPSGASVQQLEDEIWCVLPEDMADAMKEAS